MPPSTRIVCPHCERLAVRAHPSRCPDNPEMRARLAAALADLNKPGYAISRNLYMLHSCTLKLPAEMTLRSHFGSWSATVAAFGLKEADVGRKAKPHQPRKRTRQKDEVSICPHCNAQFSSSKLPRHLRCCLHRPGMRERLRAIVEESPGCGCGISLTDYRRNLDDWRMEQPEGAEPLPAVPTIKTYFPEWDNFLHWLGLLSEDEVIDAKAAADNARYRAAWQEHHAHELDSWGLPVASVQKPNPIVRKLPSGGTATMIR